MVSEWQGVMEQLCLIDSDSIKSICRRAPHIKTFFIQCFPLLISQSVNHSSSEISHLPLQAVTHSQIIIIIIKCPWSSCPFVSIYFYYHWSIALNCWVSTFHLRTRVTKGLDSCAPISNLVSHGDSWLFQLKFPIYKVEGNVSTSSVGLSWDSMCSATLTQSA